MYCYGFVCMFVCGLVGLRFVIACFVEMLGLSSCRIGDCCAVSVECGFWVCDDLDLWFDLCCWVLLIVRFGFWYLIALVWFGIRLDLLGLCRYVGWFGFVVSFLDVVCYKCCGYSLVVYIGLCFTRWCACYVVGDCCDFRFGVLGLSCCGLGVLVC